MKCANCGAKLQVGSIYCSFCGKEAQIVSDYSILEDEILQEMLSGQEKNSDLLKESMGMADAGGQPGAQDAIQPNGRKRQAGSPKEGSLAKGAGASGNKTKEGAAQGKKGSASGEAGSSKKKGASRKKRKPIGWAVAAILLMVFLLVDILFMLNHSRNNSYDYQMGQAEKCYDRRDYEDAEKFLLRAVELSDGQLEGHLLLARVYRLQGKTEKAIKTLQDIIQNEKKKTAATKEECRQAYQQLIQIYEEEGDFDAIYELYGEVEDEDILQLFEGYRVEPPEFVQGEGVYEEMVSIELSSQPGCEIFYTTDGSDPRQGAEYQGPISLEPGVVVKIRAICRNGHGVYSEETEGSFEIDLPKPDMPRVSPMGGNFYEPQAISVYVPSGCSVYYTWDGSAPSEASSRYMGPIDMPEGNNILSLILVDEYGRYSDVLKCNYIYFP